MMHGQKTSNYQSLRLTCYVRDTSLLKQQVFLTHRYIVLNETKKCLTDPQQTNI